MTVEQVIKIPGGEKCAIFWQLNPTPPKKHNPTGLMVVLTPGGQSVGLRQNGGGWQKPGSKVLHSGGGGGVTYF